MYKTTLNNGIAMPVIGYGTFQITNPIECEQCVRDAIDVGYRLIDTAAHYNNIEYVGEGVRNSGIPREELFISSKLLIPDNNYERAKTAIDRQLTKMGLDYLDMMLIHHPYGDVYGAWRALTEAYKAGKLRAIGVSNFEPYRLMDFVLNNDTIPAINQVETHPYCQQIKAKKVMNEFNIKLVASETLAQGRNNLFHDERLVTIAEHHNKTVGQIVLRWHLQNGHIIIPKTVHKERMIENYNIFDFNLTPDEIAIFNPMDPGNSIFCNRRDPEIVRAFCTQHI